MGEANCSLGTWTSVTPSQISLIAPLSCGNFGTKSVQVDSMRPSDLYAMFTCQGIWKSTDYGQTWHGPINTGAGGAMVTDCAGTITLAPNGTGGSPIVYLTCIRGSGDGFWASLNGGTDFTRYVVPGPQFQDFYPPVVDPYDAQHILMAGHGVDLLFQSVDGGKTWTSVNLDPGMAEKGGTGGIYFINKGDAATTRTTWLWMAAQSGGKVGTWRTSDGGATWTRVDQCEHVNGATQIYQPGTNGVIFISGQFSKAGDGVVFSTDYGQTWAHAGLGTVEAVVFGTSRRVYAAFGWAPGPGQAVDPTLEVGDQPGTGAWARVATPPAMTQGPGRAAVTSDGTNNIVVVANYNAGLWRYVEPAN